MERTHQPGGAGQGADVVVVGGGLAGLTAAALLARDGRRVELLERADAPGGRARTRRQGQFRLNLGPHALYVAGAGAAVLRELGVPFDGASPPSGGVLTCGGREAPIPATPGALLRHRGLTLRGRLEALRFFAQVARGPLPPAACSFDAWLAARRTPPELARLLRAFVRLSTYVADTDALSAEAALRQLRQALDGVLYVHGGWESLVRGLAERAQSLGARLRTGCAVRSVAVGPAGPELRLEDGALVPARTVILAVPPRQALALLGSSAAPRLREFVTGCRPVLASCLDVGLRTLPRPDVALALDLDDARYLSCHSLAAGLAPPGTALLQLARYGEDDGGARAGLEAWLDALQPGWRAEVVLERWLPAARVCEALPTAEQGGLRGRPPVDGAGPAGVLLCGDWVGPEGLLSDASFASARTAVRLAIGTPLREAG